MLADRAEPTQGTNQPTYTAPQTEEPIGGPGRAHSRYQPTTQQLQTQTEEPIGYHPTTQQLKHKDNRFFGQSSRTNVTAPGKT